MEKDRTCAEGGKGLELRERVGKELRRREEREVGGDGAHER